MIRTYETVFFVGPDDHEVRVSLHYEAFPEEPQTREHPGEPAYINIYDIEVDDPDQFIREITVDHIDNNRGAFEDEIAEYLHQQELANAQAYYDKIREERRLNP